MPLVFLDEFDSSLGGVPLFWLKHFLAPMQDGLFLENGVYHPIGRAVFIFAGGTAHKFENFAKPETAPDVKTITGRVSTNSVHLREQTDVDSAARHAKLPDFVSRLRGFINIPTINYESDTPEPAVMLRRALIIRDAIKRRAPNILGGKEILDVHRRVVRGLLRVPRFNHGARSLQAIVGMSELNRAYRFDPGCLPSDDQLQLHVNPERFVAAMGD